MRIEDLRTEHIGQNVTIVDDGFTFAGILNGYTLNVTNHGNPTRTIARVEASVTIGALTHELTPHHTIELRTHGPFSTGGILGSQHEGQDFTAPARRIRTIIETSTPDEAAQDIARHFAQPEQPNGYVCMHGMSDQAEDHQHCDRPIRDEDALRADLNLPRLTWDRQPQPTSHRVEAIDRNGHTVRDVHLCAHGHEAHITGHEQCERLDDDLPHLHIGTDLTPHPPHPNVLQRILRALRRK